jgi:hypothetical protein
MIKYIPHNLRIKIKYIKNKNFIIKILNINKINFIKIFTIIILLNKIHLNKKWNTQEMKIKMKNLILN